MGGLVFDIQRMSVHDGPGIRTTVFLKGCPLDCIWCHNPESKAFGPELAFYREKCTGCGRCATRCPNGCHAVTAAGRELSREGCGLCGGCVEVCRGALEIIGKSMTAAEVLDEALKDKSFYAGSGGGVTFSGGEPFAQPDFLRELLALCRRAGLHTCVETAGCVDWGLIDSMSGMVDLFLYDFKESDPERHRQYTGASNERIIENLRRLVAKGAGVVLSCPIIPGLNDRAGHFDGIARLAESLGGLIEIQLRQFNRFGESKAASIGRAFGLGGAGTPGEADAEKWAGELRRRTKIPVRKN